MNDESTYRAITMHETESKIVTLSKMNLKSISSEDNPCSDDNILTNMVCRMEKVRSSMNALV